MSRGPNQAGEIYVAIKGDTTDLNQKVQEASRTAQEQNQRNSGREQSSDGVMDMLGAPVSGTNPAALAGLMAIVAKGAFDLGQVIGKLVFNFHGLNQEFENTRAMMEQQNSFMSKIVQDLKNRAEGSSVEGLGDAAIEKRKALIDKQSDLTAEIAQSKDALSTQAWDIFRTKIFNFGLMQDALPSLTAAKEQRAAEIEKELAKGQDQYEAFITRVNEDATLKGIGAKLGIDTSGLSFAGLSSGERAAITFGGAGGNATDIVNALVEIRKINEAMDQSLKRLSTAPLTVISKPERDQGDNK